MSPDTHALIVTTLLREMRKRLDEAAISARAAETFVVAGSPDQDVAQRLTKPTCSSRPRASSTG
jgi:hypothetical protein